MKKVCTKCKITKSLNEYYKDNRHKNGKTSACKSCIIAKIINYQTQHKQQISEYLKTDKGKSKQAKYLKTDKGKLVAARGHHNAWIKKSNTLSNLTLKESNIILFLQNYQCANPNCEHKHGRYFDLVKPTLDHITPVIKGGDLIKGNVQYLCQSCNSKKGIKYIDYRTDCHKEMIITLPC